MELSDRRELLLQKHKDAQAMVINLEQALQNWRAELIKLAGQIDLLQTLITEQQAGDGKKDVVIVPKGVEVKR